MLTSKKNQKLIWMRSQNRKRKNNGNENDVRSLQMKLQRHFENIMDQEKILLLFQ